MTDVRELLEPLRRLHSLLRDQLISACQLHTPTELSEVIHNGAGDVTFMVDRISEVSLIARFDRDIAVREPIVLIGEGLPGGRIVVPSTATASEARWRIIVDPIDGTRGLIYQKRPGWILTGVAPNHGDATCLADIELAVQTEIPLLKQNLSDQLWAIRGAGAQGERYSQSTLGSEPLLLKPSMARSLRNGFATVCRFFPGGRELLGALDDELCARLLGKVSHGQASVSNDQYACTGGQIYGLVTGQDRFVADLRPLLESALSLRGESLGHCCHPYDLCTKLIAEEAGVLVTDECGGEISAPLDTEANVAWIGYANGGLREQIEPVLMDLLDKHRLGRGVTVAGDFAGRGHG